MSTKTPERLRAALAVRGADHEKIAEGVRRHPERLDCVLGCMDAREPAIKYGAGKVLRILSQKAPTLVYREFDAVARLLDSDATFNRWGAIIILGNLAPADRDGRIEAILDRFLAPIPGPVMIEAANTIEAAGKIAAAQPRLAARIAREILKVETARYKTAECRNVAIGQAIQALDRFIDRLRDRRPVLEFVRGQLDNTRPATRKKAEAFLRRHEKRSAARG